MTTVLIFEHRGLGLALPAGQVVAAAFAQDSSSEVVELWPGPHQEDRHALLVRSAIGPVTLSCSTPQLGRIPHAQLHALSPLLREAMRDVPYIVGAAWRGDKALWLLDMSRFLGAAAARIAALTARPDQDGH